MNARTKSINKKNAMYTVYRARKIQNNDAVVSFKTHAIMYAGIVNDVYPCHCMFFV